MWLYLKVVVFESGCIEGCIEPDILFIITDQQRAADIRFMGLCSMTVHLIGTRTPLFVSFTRQVIEPA